MKKVFLIMLIGLFVVVSFEGVHARSAFDSVMDGAYKQNTPQSPSQNRGSGRSSESYACVQTLRGTIQCTNVDSYSCSKWNETEIKTVFHSGKKCSDLGY